MQISFKNNFYQKKPIKNKHKRYHYYKKGGKWKPKLKFETYQEAETYLKKNKILNEYNIYCCPYCKKFHIGHISETHREEND
jgi:hypothetical protein